MLGMKSGHNVRFNDGEPSGTAGRQFWQLLKEMTDLILSW